jgi:HAD superfamily hydrolase (TIGR01509 family)
MDEHGLGKRLQQARQAAGLTQQALCQQANLSFSTLTKIERGAIKSPSIFTIQSIAGALNIGLDELIGQTGGPRPGRKLKTTKSGVKFVYFDVNGCLVHFYQRAFVGLARDTGALPDVIETVYWHYNDAVCRGDMSLDDFNTELAKRLHVDQIKWQDYYLETVESIPQMHELVNWAAEQYKTGLLTNIMPGLLSAMRRDHQIPNVAYDAVIDSSEVGAIKPEAKIFEIAQTHADCAPEEILLIDDSRVNLMAAEKMGWHVLWFDDARAEESVSRARQALEPAD